MKYAGTLYSLPYMSSQKGEFIIFGYAKLLCVIPMALLLEESILLVTLVHVRMY